MSASGISEADLDGGAHLHSSGAGLSSIGRNHACTSPACPSSGRCFPDTSGEKLRVSMFRRVKQSLAQSSWTLFTTVAHGNSMKISKEVCSCILWNN